MSAIASQITSLTSVYSTVYSAADQRKHESSASLAFVRGIHRRPVNSPHKWPVTRKMFPFDDVIMFLLTFICLAKSILFFCSSLHLELRQSITSVTVSSRAEFHRSRRPTMHSVPASLTSSSRYADVTMISLWRLNTDTLSASLDLCDDNPPATGRFPSQRANNTEFWRFLCWWETRWRSDGITVM